MNIDAEYLGIPEPEYDATIQMPSSEFRRIVSDMSGLSDSGKLILTQSYS